MSKPEVEGGSKSPCFAGKRPLQKLHPPEGGEPWSRMMTGAGQGSILRVLGREGLGAFSGDLCFSLDPLSPLNRLYKGHFQP